MLMDLLQPVVVLVIALANISTPMATPAHPACEADQKKRSTKADRGRSYLQSPAHDAWCSEQVRVCVSDSECNKHLAPVLQACASDQCDGRQCRRATQNFYAQMPVSMKERLAMCVCDSSDQSCLQMKQMLHSGACRQEESFCLERVDQCEADNECRDLLVNLRNNCWREEDRHCHGSDPGQECLAQLDPDLILGRDPRCRESYIATLGTPLHHPCSCERLQGQNLLSCNRIWEIFHARTHFNNPLMSNSVSTEPPAPQNSQQQTYDLLYVCSSVILLLMFLLILAVAARICLLRKKNQRFHPPQKNDCDLVL